MTLKQRIFAVLASVGLLLGIGMPAASALTVYHDRSYWGASNGYTQVKYCWHDYNWWEEHVQFKKDGYYQCALRYVR